MEALYYILGYILIGCAVAGVTTAILYKNGSGSSEFIIDYVVIPLTWPLSIMIGITYGMRTLAHHLFYSKQEKVDKMVNRLTK